MNLLVITPSRCRGINKVVNPLVQFTAAVYIH